MFVEVELAVRVEERVALAVADRIIVLVFEEAQVVWKLSPLSGEVVPPDDLALEADEGAQLMTGKIPLRLVADSLFPLDVLFHHRTAQPAAEE